MQLQLYTPQLLSVVAAVLLLLLLCASAVTIYLHLLC